MGIRTLANPIAVNKTIERTALRLISHGSASSKVLLGRLDESYFGSPINRVVFRRIQYQIQRRNAIPSWQDLCNDPAFNEQTRVGLQSFTERAPVNRKTADELFEQLTVFRKRRIVFDMIKEANEGLLANKDTDTVIDAAANAVAQARVTKTFDAPLAIGKNANYADRLERLFTGEAMPVWPTGLRDFDERGGGIAVGSLVLLGGHTGGGKTNLAQTLGVNFADYGLRVGEISLEMDEDECLLRRTAAIAEIHQDKLLKAITTETERAHIRAALKKRSALWAAKNSGVYTHVPKCGVNIEQAIALVEPYGYKVVTLDYASLLDGVNGKDFWQRLGEVCRLGKLYAKNNKAIFIILIQTDKEDNIKFSNSMLMHADYAFTIKYSADGDFEDFVDIDMPKARKIKKTPFVLAKQFEFARFADYNGDHKPYDPSQKPDGVRKVTTDKPVRVQGGRQGSERQQVAKTESDPDIDAYFADSEEI